MVTIRELLPDEKEYIKPIAKLHSTAFKGFFLTQLGKPFLRTLYKGYLEDSNSGIIVALEGEALNGFIAYSNEYSLFFKRLLKRHLIKFAFCSLGAAIRHPSFIRPLLGAFKKSNEVKREDKYVELASICVDPSCSQRGIGTRLIDYLKNIVDYGTFSYINLETDALNNDAVNRFYVSNGFELFRQYYTAGGRYMNEYHYHQRSIIGDAK